MSSIPETQQAKLTVCGTCNLHASDVALESKVALVLCTHAAICASSFGKHQPHNEVLSLPVSPANLKYRLVGLHWSALLMSLNLLEECRHITPLPGQRKSCNQMPDAIDTISVYQ